MWGSESAVQLEQAADRFDEPSAKALVEQFNNGTLTIEIYYLSGYEMS